ncbi:MAG: CsbD family protein [Oligoflexia bacterium]|nr:CsbD family protein [Oligoflexia bacterium]
MNKDIAQGKWKQLKGKIQKKWGEFTNDDLDRINGNLETLAGELQERYGYSKDQAKKLIDRL